MATVPVQQTPTEQIDTGGTPLFSATNIQPVQDTGVAQDIGRLSNAQKQFAKIAADLQDQTDDVKSNEAYRGYQEEADEKVNQYLETQRGEAIATVDYDQDTNKPITQYDKLVNDLEEISGKYLETLDNKSQKQIFNDKYSASKRISVNSASKHSLKQTRLKIDEESKSNIELSKNGAVNSFESFQDQNGDYAVNYYRGLLEIKRNAELNARNTDINKGPLSSKYLEDVQAYNKEVMEGVVDKLVKLPGGHKLAEEYVKLHKPEEIKDVVTELEISIAEKHDDYNKEQCVNGVLTNNGNQNTGSFLDQTAKLMCLKSNHYVNDGNGASVHDGNHSNEINIAGQTQENNIDTLEKIRNESKFYKLDSNATLINEHQTTHLFAVQHLGVQKADSLYTKAKSLYPIDQRAYKENPKYAKAINKKIIENYNKLINEKANKKYKGDYVTAIANDLEIIEKGINYDGEFTSKVDFITGLRPLEVLKEEIKATITDPKQQKFALEDLEIKYKKIKNQRTQIYNEGLNAAKEIAFAEEGGWKNLEANGIKIENFSKSDQALLKKGQPTESDKDTVIKLKENPIEVRDNIDSYSHKLSQSDYLGLKQYAEELKGDGKVLEASIDSKLLDFVLKKKGFDDIRNKKDDTTKDDYLEIEVEWKNRIYEEQKNTGKKLNRTRKTEILEQLLNNKVIYDRGFFQGDYEKPLFTIDDDEMKNIYVKVKGETIWLKTINDFQRKKIMQTLDKFNLPITSQNIADYWVRGGRSPADNEIDDTLFQNKRKKSLK